MKAGEQPSPSLTLTDAQSRLARQLRGWWKSDDYGTKASRNATWGIVETGQSAADNPALDRLMRQSPGDWRRTQIKQLGEWLENVILTKNAGSQLQKLAACLKARRVSQEQAPRLLTSRFRKALQFFLHHPTKPRVPTLAAIRHKMNKSENFKAVDSEDVRKQAKKLGWNDLPHGRGGRPKNTPTSKRSKR